MKSPVVSTKNPELWTKRQIVKKLLEPRRHARWLENLTVSGLRRQLDNELQEVSLSNDALADEDRRWFLELFASVPSDRRFWAILRWAKKQERSHPGDAAYDARLWVEVFLREIFVEKYGEPTPLGWIPAASSVFEVLSGVRNIVSLELKVTPYQHHKRWKQGDERGLLGAVARGMIDEGWVSQALATLQQKMVTAETSEERKEAGILLRRIAKILIGIGGGRHQEYTTEQQKEKNRKRKRDYDAQVREAEDDLQQRIKQQIDKLPARVWRNTQKAQAEEQAIYERVRQEALASKKGAIREAGRRLQRKQKQALR